MNKYLEKIAILNPVAKKFALRVAESISGNTPRINSVYSAASGVVNKKIGASFTSAEKTNIAGKLKQQADKIVGPSKLHPMEASRAARAGARLARMQNR